MAMDDNNSGSDGPAIAALVNTKIAVSGAKAHWEEFIGAVVVRRSDGETAVLSDGHDPSGFWAGELGPEQTPLDCGVLAVAPRSTVATAIATALAPWLAFSRRHYVTVALQAAIDVFVALRAANAGTGLDPLVSNATADELSLALNEADSLTRSLHRLLDTGAV